MSSAAVINATQSSGLTAGSPVTIATDGTVTPKLYGTGTGAWSVTAAFAPVVGGVVGNPISLTIDSNNPNAIGPSTKSDATQWVGWITAQTGLWSASGIIEGITGPDAQSGFLGTFAVGALPQYAVETGSVAMEGGTLVSYGGAGVGWVAVGANKSIVSDYLSREYNPENFVEMYTAGDCAVTRDATSPNLTGSRRPHDVVGTTVLYTGAKANHTVVGFTTQWSYSDHNRQADNAVVQKGEPWSSEITTDSAVVVLNLCVGSDGIAGQFSIYIGNKMLGEYTIASTTLPDRVILTFASRQRRTITICATKSVGFWRAYLWTTDSQSNTFPPQSIYKGFFGDSYTVGQGIADGSAKYQHYVTRLAGTPAFISSGLSGTGFAVASARGRFFEIAPRFLATLIKKPDLLYVIGGINDHAQTEGDVSSGADAFYKAIKEASPSTCVITYITSRASLYTLPIGNVNAIIAAAKANGFVAYDIGGILLSGNLFSDGLHPNEAGAKVMGTWIGDKTFFERRNIS